MDLTKFSFPIIKGIDAAFSLVKTNPELLAEAKSRGFYNGRTEYNRLFSILFFSGGKIAFKDGINDDFRKSAWPYCRALMSSFEPKHEEKEAVCAMLMSELLDPPKETPLKR